MESLNEEKKFYDRFWNLLNDEDLMKVFEKYGPTAFRRSSVLEGFEKFIKENGFSGHICLEIGTLKGLTAIVLSRYFQKVITVDIIDDPMKYEIADFLGVKNIEFINVKNNEEKKETIDDLLFDACYQDGNHANDTNEDFRLVKRCGRVMFHEFWNSQIPVMNLVSALELAGSVGLAGKVVKKGKFALWTA